MTAQHLSTLMTQKIETPSAANNLRKRLSQLFDYAIILEWRKDNPARAVRSLRTRKGGFPTWHETEIAIFEGKFPRGLWRGWLLT